MGQDSHTKTPTRETGWYDFSLACSFYPHGHGMAPLVPDIMSVCTKGKTWKDLDKYSFTTSFPGITRNNFPYLERPGLQGRWRLGGGGRVRGGLL